ncbi:MAG TPA: tyrosine-type recombinase/integrase [Anaeromyxobacter sp.]|nr:tyrosine-type recombinase/integrase [Anaeromyxobacter sp.]
MIGTPPRGLTPKFIEALQPAEKVYSVADRRAPGLRLRVFPSGVRSFHWTCNTRSSTRSDARGRSYTIGKWSFSEQPGFVTLAQAREWLERLKAGHASGTIDAVEAEIRVYLKRRAHLADPAPEAPDRRTFGAVAEEFYRDDVLTNRKHPDDVRAILDNDLVPALGARPLNEISAVECRDVVRRVVTGRGRTVGGAAPTHAGKVLAIIKQIFTRAQGNGITDRNPAAALRPDKIGVIVNKRDRCLDDPHKKIHGEIAAFWRALEADRAPQPMERPDPRTGKVQSYAQPLHTMTAGTATALKILLLTGVRTGALLNARWENVDLDGGTWTIPPSDQKLTKRQEREAKPFVVPLTATALDLLKGLRKLARSSTWVMASEKSHDGILNEKTLGHALLRLQRSGRLVLAGGEVRPHDLRRTMRTHLGQTLRVSPHIAERCLGHSLGRIVETYDVGEYLDERRDALERWDGYVQRLIDPAASNVVPLARTAP